LWALAEQLLPARDVAAYTQGLMDLGAKVCMRSHPRCGECPLAEQCLARLQDRVGEFPTPRPRKLRPQRSTVMLVMECDGEIMMEKRPSPGIWGGLWSFPETDHVDAATQVCRTQFGVETHAVERMAPIEHGFTHFSLTIAPLYCRVSQPEPRAQQPGRVWIAPDEAMRYAIPVPVRKLLARLRQSCSGPGAAVQAD
jgi:A/G-specific adenine glycosylase